MTMATLTIDELKSQAKRLRDAMAGAGTPVSHSAALELVAKSHGLRDWNTMSALAQRTDNAERPPASVGAKVRGRYLGQPFTGTVMAISRLSDSSFYQITLHFDEPVDVVTFESFSAFRQRVTGTVDADGRSPRKTSNGQPQIVLDL